MPNVTKKDLIDGIAERTGEKRGEVRLIVEELLATIRTELGKGHRIELRDFGIFEIKYRAPRLAQNPKTLEKVEVPAKASVKFKPGRRLKRQIDGAHPPIDGGIADTGATGSKGSKSDLPDVTVIRAKDDMVVEPKTSHDQSGARNK